MLDRHAAAIAAHDAAVERLEAAYLVLAVEEGHEDDVDPVLYAQAANQLAAPFCGCLTCVVREVLDAGEPDMARLVALSPSIN